MALNQVPFGAQIVHDAGSFPLTNSLMARSGFFGQQPLRLPSQTQAQPIMLLQPPSNVYLGIPQRFPTAGPPMYMARAMHLPAVAAHQQSYLQQAPYRTYPALQHMVNLNVPSVIPSPSVGVATQNTLQIDPTVPQREATKRNLSIDSDIKRARNDADASESDQESEVASENGYDKSISTRTSSSNSISTSTSTARVKGPWTIKEDAMLKQLVKQYGKRWSLVAEKLPGRIGKQCRERWLNHLDPKINRNPWTVAEDRILLDAQKALGNKWSEIAKMLPGRPENSVKNRFTSLSQRSLHG